MPIEAPLLDSKGELATPSVLAQIDARTRVTMRADLPTLATELNIGGADALVRAEKAAADLAGIQTAVSAAVGQSPADSAVAVAVATPSSQSRAAVRSQALDAVGARVVFTEDPSISVPDGTLVVHYQGPRTWTEEFSDGLAGMTPRLTERSTWTSSDGAAIMPAARATPFSSPRALSIDRLGEGESVVELLGEVSTSALIGSSVCGLIARGRGYGSKQWGLGAALTSDGVRVIRWVDGVFTFLHTFGVGNGLVAAGAKQLLRLQVGHKVGTSERIRVKSWRSGSPEPSGWDYDAGINPTTSVTGPGWAGLYSGGEFTGVTQSWHRVAVATQGETAVFG